MSDGMAIENVGTITRLSLCLLRDILPDKVSCLACGLSITKKEINVHHVNYDPSDDRINNLSLLCQSCHTAAHLNKDGGWRRNIYPMKALSSSKHNRVSKSWEDKFNDRFVNQGGIEGFKKLYMDDGVSMAEIGIIFGCVRERIRQFAARLDLPPRGRGFLDGDKRKHYGFPYPHRPLSDYLQKNNISPKEMANKLGMSYLSFNHLLNMVRPVSASRAIEIISATNGDLTVEQLINPIGGATA